MRKQRFDKHDRTRNDISTSSIILTFVLLGTIVAGHTSHPVFWLLVGPAPLGIGFTAIVFFRQGLRRNHSLAAASGRTGYTSGGSSKSRALTDHDRPKQHECA